MAMRILIVDDDPADALEIGNVVAAVVDAEAQYAVDRHQAWASIQASMFDVIVLDMNLGGLHEGSLLLNMLQTRLAKPPGVVIVSRSGNQPWAREMRAKFGFVTEVVSKKDLGQLQGVLKKALLEAAVQSQPAAPVVAGRRALGPAGRVALIAAVITALGAIGAAVIEKLPDLLRMWRQR